MRDKSLNSKALSLKKTKNKIQYSEFLLLPTFCLIIKHNKQERNEKNDEEKVSLSYAWAEDMTFAELFLVPPVKNLVLVEPLRLSKFLLWRWQLCVFQRSVLLPDLLWHWQDDFSWKKVSSSLRIFPALEVSFPLSLTCQRCRPPSALKRMLKCCALRRELHPAAAQRLGTQVGMWKAEILHTRLRPKVQTTGLVLAEGVQKGGLVVLQSRCLREIKRAAFHWSDLKQMNEDAQRPVRPVWSLDGARRKQR